MLIERNGMFQGKHIMIPRHDKKWHLDGIQLGQGDIGIFNALSVTFFRDASIRLLLGAKRS